MKNRIGRVSAHRIVLTTWSIWALLIVGCDPASLEETSKYRELTREEAQQYEQLQVYIEFEYDEYQQYELPLVQITYTNASEYPIRIHTSLLPSEDFWGNNFLVTFDGEAVDYIGRLIRRTIPVDSDFIYLEPRESIDGAIDLSRLYDFSQTGQYRIQFVADPEMIGYHSSPEEFQIVSNWIVAHVEGRTTPRARLAPGMLQVVDGIGFIECSPSQQADLKEALRWAERYALESRQHLGRNPTGDSDRYKTWFGQYSSDRLKKVFNIFRKVRRSIRRNTITFKCKRNHSCSGAIAWVWPYDEYKIHLCSSFWDDPMTGYYSKAETIIHEMTHFKSVGFTIDHRYGLNPCKELAIEHPNRAVNNADNFSFFSTESDHCWEQLGDCDTSSTCEYPCSSEGYCSIGIWLCTDGCWEYVGDCDTSSTCEFPCSSEGYCSGGIWLCTDGCWEYVGDCDTSST